MNELSYLSVWGKLDKSQQNILTVAASRRIFKKGEFLHNGLGNCIGLILVLSGQIRAFTISDDGREITLYRLFERDICLFSAACMMNSIQFDVTVSAEKDTEVLLSLPIFTKALWKYRLRLLIILMRLWRAVSRM